MRVVWVAARVRAIQVSNGLTDAVHVIGMDCYHIEAKSFHTTGLADHLGGAGSGGGGLRDHHIVGTETPAFQAWGS